MKKISIHKPFRLLKAIRDGELQNQEQLTTRGSLWKIPIRLQNIMSRGFIKYNEDTGEINSSNKEIFELFDILDISLTELQEYDPRYSMIVRPVFNTRGLKNQNEFSSSFVFVLMPFSNQLQPIFTDHLKPVINKLSYSCLRGDDFFTTQHIMEDVWKAIVNAKIVVAECTGRNPNVFYELGIAHTLGKKVVLISQNSDDIPFDLKHIRTIIYEFTPGGMKIFEEALEKTLRTAFEEDYDGWPEYSF